MPNDVSPIPEPVPTSAAPGAGSVQRVAPGAPADARRGGGLFIGDHLARSVRGVPGAPPPAPRLGT
jgi:hypothetical protein